MTNQNITDLFDHVDLLPMVIRSICEGCDEKFMQDESPNHHLINQFLEDVERFGYTFDIDLDFLPMNLRKIKKYQVDYIELERKEGPRTDKKTYRLNSYAEANELLLLWSQTAPKHGGYDKCDYTVIFEDGTRWQGRYDLKHYTCKQDTGNGIDIAKNIRDYCFFESGLVRPRYFNDDMWSNHLQMIETSKDRLLVFLELYEV